MYENMSHVCNVCNQVCNHVCKYKSCLTKSVMMSVTSLIMSVMMSVILSVIKSATLFTGVNCEARKTTHSLFHGILITPPSNLIARFHCDEINQ